MFVTGNFFPVYTNKQLIFNNGEHILLLMTLRILLVALILFLCSGIVSLPAQDSVRWAKHYDSLVNGVESARLSGNNVLLAQELLTAGTEMMNSYRHSEALNYLRQSADLYLVSNDSFGYARSIFSLAYCYYLTGQYDLSLDNCLKSSSIAEALPDTQLLANDIILHGRLYYLLGNEDTSITFYRKARELGLEIRDGRIVAEALTFSAIVLRNQRKFDEASELLRRALNIRDSIGDSTGIGYNLMHMAILLSYQRNDSAAIKLFQRAEILLIKYNDLHSLTECYNAMAKSYLQLGNEALAAEYFRKSLQIALRLRAKKLIRYNYYDLAMLSHAHNNDSEAFRLLYYYTLYKDSVLADQSLLQTAQIEHNLVAEKKANEIKLLNNSNALKEAQLAKSQTVIWAVSGCLTLVVLMTVIILYNLQQKRKVNALLAASNAEVVKKNESIVDSIKYAKGIQEAVLPTADALRRDVGEHFVVYKPRDIVSGDFYWSYKSGHLIFFAVADCTGHGVPGAFMSLLGTQILNHAVIEHQLKEPARILDFANEKTKELLLHRGLHDTTRDGMDIAFCCIDSEKRVVEFAGANNPLIIMQGSEMKEIKADKQSIGAASRAYQNHTTGIAEGDIIYVFTDGFADQFGGTHNRKFSSRGLRELLLTTAQRPFNEQAKHLDNFFEDWKGTNEQTDDALIMGFRITWNKDESVS